MKYRITIRFATIVSASESKERIGGSIAKVYDVVTQKGRIIEVLTNDHQELTQAFFSDGFSEAITIETGAF